jgi:MFS transporter, FSR family, fosmidomycin resistance protein
MTELCKSALRNRALRSAPMANTAAVLSIYGTAHVVVDAICAAVVIASAESLPPDAFAGLVLLYHVLAFGLQSLFGLAVDATGMPRFAAVLGCLVSGSALLFPSLPTLAIALAGLGNAAFHVGGGYTALRITPQRATAPGLFVAPGSLGLLIGVILGKSGRPVVTSFLVIVAVLCVLIISTRVPGHEATRNTRRSISRGEIVLGFVLLSIAVRSVLGFLVNFPWETHSALLIVLTMATVAGKSLGGILADRWGWVRVGVSSLVAALPFLAAAATYPLAAIPGLFLLNLTMPVTLAAVSEALPGYPGFAFGLTSLALLAGALPPLLGITAGGPVFVCVVILFSAVALHRGLRLLPFDHSFRKMVQV